VKKLARGSVVKRGKRYHIIYYVGKKQKWKGSWKTKAQAEKALVETMNKINFGEYKELKEATFSEFAEKFLSFLKGRVKKSTYDFYRYIIVPYLIPYFGDYSLKAITPFLIEEYLAEKRKEGRLSQTSLSYHLRVLKTMFKKATLWEFLIRNPAELVESIPRREKKEMDIFSLEELRLFLETVKKKDPKFYPLFLTAALTGMRRGELLALKWEDINWNTSQIHVRRTLSSDGKFTSPKTKAAVRAIIVPPSLLSVLKKWRLACPPSRLDLVFPNEKGKPMDAKNLIHRHFLPNLRRAGLKRIRFHDLRHTYASILIAQGENLKFIQSQLGHASSRMTLDRYGHLMPQVQHGAEKRLEKAFSPATSQRFLSKSLAKSGSYPQPQERLQIDTPSEVGKEWWALEDLNL